MPPVTPLERRKISHELKKMGFGGIEDANLYPQIASLYTTHEAFRGLLMSTAPGQRRIAYEALKFHLSFEPRTLEQYEMEIKQKAEREQWDVYDGTVYPKPFKVSEVTLNDRAEKAIANDLAARSAKGFLTLECPRCTFEETFPGETRADAAIKARKAGWTLVEIQCPKCNGLSTQTIQ